MDKQSQKQEETLKIISLYRERELLWDTTSYNYRRNDLKKKALEEIALECKMTEECAKKKLKSLQSTYFIEKRKVDQSKESGCDAGDVYEPALFWYGEMSFLDSSIRTRKSKDNFSDYFDEPSTSKSAPSDVSCAPLSSRKRKCEEQSHTDKFDDAISKIAGIHKVDKFSSFADYMFDIDCIYTFF